MGSSHDSRYWTCKSCGMTFDWESDAPGAANHSIMTCRVQKLREQKESERIVAEKLRSNVVTLKPPKVKSALDIIDIPAMVTTIKKAIEDAVALKRYTVGFAFDSTLTKVALIRKNRPEKLKGLLNGEGGSIEVGESPVGCMSREFHEEAGVLLPPERWVRFHYERHASGTCLYFYAARLTDEEFAQVRTMTDEKIEIHEPARMVFHERRVKSNLVFLLPMAKHALEHPEEIPLEG